MIHNAFITPHAAATPALKDDFQKASPTLIEISGCKLYSFIFLPRPTVLNNRTFSYYSVLYKFQVLRLGRLLLKKPGRQVAFAGIRQNNHDEFAFVLRPPGHF